MMEILINILYNTAIICGIILAVVFTIGLIGSFLYSMIKAAKGEGPNRVPKPMPYYLWEKGNKEE